MLLYWSYDMSIKQLIRNKLYVAGYRQHEHYRFITGSEIKPFNEHHGPLMADVLRKIQWPNPKTWVSYMQADNEVVVGGSEL